MRLLPQMPRFSCDEMAELACSFAADWFQEIADRRWSSLKDELATVTVAEENETEGNSNLPPDRPRRN